MQQTCVRANVGARSSRLLDCLSRRQQTCALAIEGTVAEPAGTSVTVGARELGGAVQGQRRLFVVCAAAVLSVGLGTSTAGAQDETPYPDVPADAYYAAPVRTLAGDGVFADTLCDDGFCPDKPLDRKTMAVWTVRLLDGADPPAVAGTRFDDVDTGGFHAAFIERMAALGVTGGCGDGSGFCPDRHVTRAQMAVFLSRAYELPDGPDPNFTDVLHDAWYAADVAKLAASGISVGCGDGNAFCPDRDTTRAQMATFLWRAENPAQRDVPSDTPTGPPGRPRNIRIDYRPERSLTIHWQPPLYGGEPDYYLVDGIGPGYFFPPVDPSMDEEELRLFLRETGGIRLYHDGRTSYDLTIDYETRGVLATREHERVRVIAVNRLGLAISDEISVLSNFSKSHHEMRSTTSDAVETYGDAVPWLREVWSYITEREKATDPVHLHYRSKGFTFLNEPFSESGGSPGRADLYTECDPSLGFVNQICKSAGASIASVSRSFHYIMAHELGHIYTLSNDAPKNPLAVVAGHLYLLRLMTSDPSWYPGKRASNDKICDSAELYADLATLLVLEQIDEYSWRLGYWSSCTSTGVPPAEDVAVVRSSLSGQVPQWFYDTYQKEDGSYELANLWRDVTAAYSGATNFMVYALRDHFGGYCSDALQQITSYAYSHLELSNPWRDGGCALQAASEGHFTAVSAGSYHSCGLRADATIECWGYNPDGRADPPDGRSIELSDGGGVCGIRSDRTVECWGSADTEEFAPPDGEFSVVTVGHYGSVCGIRTNGRAECWGINNFGQADPPDGSFIAIDVGRYHSCGVRSDHSLTCWGFIYDRHTLAEMDLPAGRFTSVSAGDTYACALRDDRTIECWTHGCSAARNDGSRSCYGSTDGSKTEAPSGAFRSISTLATHSCGIRVEGTIACWGDNQYGQANPPAGVFTYVSAGKEHSCGVRANGTVECWGSNRFGQISVQ